MEKEEFLYNFLTQFNTVDNKKNKSSKEYWKEKGFTGEFLYYLRNILVHQTQDEGIFKYIEQNITYMKILNLFKDITLLPNEKDKIIYITFISDYYEEYFIKKGYLKKEYNRYTYYEKKTNIKGLNYNIFIYNNEKKDGFFTKNIHSYNHQNMKNNKIYIDDDVKKVYISSEKNNDELFIRINNYELNDKIPIILEIRIITEKDNLKNKQIKKYNLFVPLPNIFDDEIVNDKEENEKIYEKSKKLSKLRKEIQIPDDEVDFLDFDDSIYNKILNSTNSEYIRTHIVDEINKGFKELEQVIKDINV